MDYHSAGAGPEIRALQRFGFIEMFLQPREGERECTPFRCIVNVVVCAREAGGAAIH